MFLKINLKVSHCVNLRSFLSFEPCLLIYQIIGFRLSLSDDNRCIDISYHTQITCL